MTQQAYEKAISLMDAANGEDPNIEMADAKEWPKELLYSHRMSDMLERFRPSTDYVMKLAIRGQHIQRWKSPREDYPMDRTGYLQWRADLYKFHGNTVAGLMAEAGFDDEALTRVKVAIGKRQLKSNDDTKLLEDVAGLVFIEHYMQAFADKHPEYSEEKWIDIIQKTWKKMTLEAHDFALSGSLKLPQALIPLIQKSVTG